VFFFFFFFWFFWGLGLEFVLCGGFVCLGLGFGCD
jgi:hypothetical protein